MPANQVTGAGRSEHSKPGRRTGLLPGRWWSVDPGEKHVGVAQWREEHLLFAKEMSPEEFKTYVRLPGPDLIVIEAFSLRSPKWTNAQSKQAIATIKLIGYVEACMDDLGGRVVEQQPSVRHVAQASKYWRLLREQIPANSHVKSAIAHGLYYQHFAKR